MRVLISLSLVFLLTILSGCKKDDSPTPEFVVNYIDIPSPSLKNNKVEADTIQKARIYYPPFYASNPNKRYPVLYFIHGYGDSFNNDYGIFKAAYEEMSAGTINEFFIVNVNSNCKIGGTFCANSPVTGNWEDQIVNDVIAYIDANFRTIPNKESRGISGFSMGGFGALYLGFRHADTYNLVYAISPGVLKESDFYSAYNMWRSDGSFITAYGATFSPNFEIGYPHSEKPILDGTEKDSLIIENWKNGFCYFDRKLEHYLSGTSRIKRFAIDYGVNDYYGWIPRGCKYLASLFDDNSIPYDIYPRNPGGHEVSITNVKGYMLPFFSTNFSFE